MLGNVRINLENCTFWMMGNDGIKNCLRKLEKTRKEYSGCWEMSRFGQKK